MSKIKTQMCNNNYKIIVHIYELLERTQNK